MARFRGRPVPEYFRSFKRQHFNENTAGDHVGVPAVTEKRLRLVGFLLSVTGAVGIEFKSGSTNVRGPYPISSGGLWESKDFFMQFETGVGEAIVLGLDANVQVRGDLFYEEV